MVGEPRSVWSSRRHLTGSAISIPALGKRHLTALEGVIWLRHLVQRWGARNFSLVCPRCRHPASSPMFRRGRYMLGDEKLVCEECGETSVVTFWRFEGLSCRADRTEAMRRAPLPNSRH